MADHSTTRDQLIEQAAQELRHVSARFGQHLDARRAAIALADAGLLADPEKAISLTYYQELAAGYKGQMARADALQARLDAALVLVDGYATAFGDAKMLRRIRAELADVHPGRPVLPITDDDFDLLETEEL